jgi:type I restriction enzyme M protein
MDELKPRAVSENSPLTSKNSLDETHRLANTIWAFVDAARSRREVHWGIDLLAPLAALLILRWAAYDEAEYEEHATLVGKPFIPRLPSSLRILAWQRRDIDGIISSIEGFRHDTRRGHDVAPAQYIAMAMSVLQGELRRARQLTRDTAFLLAQFPFQSPKDFENLAEIIEALIEKALTFKDRYAGEFITPLPIVKLMVELAEPLPGDRVYDPCFGMGGLLVAAAMKLRGAAKTPREWIEIQQHKFFGIERNPRAYVIGLCRLLLLGIKRPNLECEDTLERQLPQNRDVAGFDCLLMVPPWGGQRSVDSATSQYPVPSTSVDTLFLQHAMACLRPGGRAVIALPEGTLFSTGKNSIVRKYLLTEFHVDGVISLPPGAFRPYTAIKSNLVVFRREKPRTFVRFIRASTGMEGPVDADWGPGGTREIVQALRTGQEAPWLWDVPIKKLAERDYSLSSIYKASDELEQKLNSIRAADPRLKITAIESIAHVFAGISYGRASTSSRPDAPGVISGLLRVGDISKPTKAGVSLFLLEAGATRIREHHWLRPGDVLVTKDGTIGKIAMVAKQDSRLVPSNGVAVVRTSELLTPDFLAALLRSPAYQFWMKEYARGAIIRHLPLNAFRKLLVPVPSISLQLRVLEEIGSQGDALQALLRISTGAPQDPISAWLETSNTVAQLRPSAEFTDDISVLLDRFATEFLAIAKKIEQAPQATFPIEIGAWLDVLRTAALGLRQIDKIPKGTPRLAALEVLRPRLEEANRLLERSDAFLARQARTLTAGVLLALDREVRTILGPISIALRLSPYEVVMGAPREVRVVLRNTSSVALRDVFIETQPSFGSDRIAYLAEETSFEVPLALEPAEPGALHVLVRWIAQRLDGQPFSGEAHLSVHVQPAPEAKPQIDIGTSPYVVGNPVEREEMFFGREEIIERIKRQLGTEGSANIILLEGNRRTGKTSILEHLRRSDHLPDWIPVYCSFQAADGDERRLGIHTRDVFRLMARTIAWELHRAGVKTWIPGAPPAVSDKPFKLAFLSALDYAFSGDRAFEAFELYLAEAIAAARPRRILFMLDEFDKLQEGIDAGVTSPHVPENIRHFLQHNREITAIITGSRRLKRLREEYWSALFGLGHRIGISELPIEAAQRLVTEPVSGRLQFLQQARDLIVELCARHPFLIQTLCNWLFERAVLTGKRTITTDTVHEVVEDMIIDNEHFQTLWGYAKTWRRRLLLALCERLASTPDPVNLPILELKMQEYGVPLEKRDALSEDIEYLRELEMIEFDSEYRSGTYRLSIPLMAHWMHRTIDFDDVTRRARQEGEAQL